MIEHVRSSFRQQLRSWMRGESPKARRNTGSKPQVSTLEGRELLAVTTPIRAAALSVAVDVLDDPNRDGIVVKKQIGLVGTTDPGAKVILDVNSDGDTDQRTTADSNGVFRFDAPLRRFGATQFRLATKSGGQTLEETSLTVRRQGVTETAKISQVAGGLNSPRGLNFGPDGKLYVAIAGVGGESPRIPSPSLPGATLGFGREGSVIRFQFSKGGRRAALETVIKGAPSLATNGDDASGPNDIVFDSRGLPFLLTGLAGSPAERDTVLKIPDFATLTIFSNRLLNQTYSYDNLKTRLYTDFAALEAVNNFDGGDVISNPFSATRYLDGFAVVDAGANSLHILNSAGSVISTTPFPTRLAPLPGAPGVQIPMQPVPTCVAVGPDGALYVGQLTGFPFPGGGASVFRVIPGRPPEVFLTGFTHIIDIAFDKHGDLFVLQFSDQSLLSGLSSASLIHVAKDGQRTTITDQLSSPTGMTIGPDGVVYVSNDAYSRGRGQILRIKPRIA